MTRLLIVKEGANVLRSDDPISNKLGIGVSQGSSQSSAVIRLQPLALPPLAATQFLSISKRSLSRLIAAGKIVARGYAHAGGC
jgi:hypothetical protein